MDLLLALITLGAVGYFLVWQDFLRPLLGLDKPRSVKNSPTRASSRPRSRRSRVPNVANAGSVQQHAKNEVRNVPPNVPGSAAIAAPLESPAAPAGDYVLSANELQQLAAAVAARAAGATEAEAIKAGFGASKGGGPAYRRAKELFDAATKAP